MGLYILADKDGIRNPKTLQATSLNEAKKWVEINNEDAKYVFPVTTLTTNQKKKKKYWVNRRFLGLSKF